MAAAYSPHFRMLSNPIQSFLFLQSASQHRVLTRRLIGQMTSITGAALQVGNVNGRSWAVLLAAGGMCEGARHQAGRVLLQKMSLWKVLPMWRMFYYTGLLMRFTGD